MIQKHRISTNIGKDLRVNVEVNQNFDIMEILSLKFSQKDIFASGNCSEYGVVVGRVSANNGFGVPNARVSIFIPQDSMDADDPVISALYPYQEISDKDENGYRYNLLPSRQQHSGQSPTGTFPDQQDIMTREEWLEVFESYYKYTVKTNEAGDFMIWGVPIGTQTIHVDLDLSDIGCFSLRPYDFIKKGFAIGDFERFYEFKSSSDIDGLPQIVTFDRTIEVYPLWGNEDLCEIGITRTDFDLSDKGIRIDPISLILVSTITDDNGDSVKRNGKIRKKAGYKCNLQTSGGQIECVRQTGGFVYGSDGVTKYPELEYFTVTEVIDENGVAMAALPMNLDYVYTDEFGEEAITNDPNKGIPTSAIARFRFSLDFEDSKIATAHYLVPNIREWVHSSVAYSKKGYAREYYESWLSSYIFSDVFEDYLEPPAPDGVSYNGTGYFTSVQNHKKDLMLGTDNNNIPEDVFYKFVYGKVYTVSSFQGTHYESARRDAFLGIKQIRPASDEDCAASANYLPTNFGFKNRTKFSLLLAQVVLFVQYIFAAILIKFAEIIGRFFWALGRAFYNIGIRRWRPFRGIAERFYNAAYNMQDKFTKQLPLTIYPDCEECTTDVDAQVDDASFIGDYCRVAELKVNVIQRDDHRSVRLYTLDSDSGTDFQNGESDWSYLSQNDPTWPGPGTANPVNELFLDEYSRNGDGLCSGSTVVVYDSPGVGELELTDLYNYTITLPDGSTGPRYVIEVFPYADTWLGTGTTIFSSYVAYLNGGDSEISENQWFVANTPGGYNAITLGFDQSNGSNPDYYYSYEQWNELTGMDFDVLPPDLTDDLHAIVRIYDRSITENPEPEGVGLEIEAGCEKYDKTYDESIVFGYIWTSGSTYGSTYVPLDPTGLPETTTNIQSYTGDTGYEAWGYREFLKTTTSPPSPYVNLASTIIGRSNTKRLPYKKEWRKIPDATYDRKSKSGLSEFRDGVFTIIPVIAGTSYNLRALREWYRRKRVGLGFCGGVINYSFIDNWLHGLLYFFKFDNRLKWDNEEIYDLNQRGSKYPRELIFFNILDKKYYYRSCPYYGPSETFVGQDYDSVIGGSSSTNQKQILHPTTFYDLGVRDEFLEEICVDDRVDPTCSVIRDISYTSYQDPGPLVEYAISYRLDINDGDFDINDFFSGTNYGSNIDVFDGDVTQLMSINCETGIEAFDLDSPHYYMYNDEMMDPEDGTYDDLMKSGGDFGPIAVDLKFDNNGERLRSCLNYRLGDNSQVVPFYLWDKDGEGFGSGGADSDDQTWDKTDIGYMKLQRLFSVSGATPSELTTTNYLMSNGEEEYLLKPMTVDHDIYWWEGDYEDALERFEQISYSQPTYTAAGQAQSLMGFVEGDLWLEVTSGSLSDPTAGNVWAVVDSTWVEQSGYYYNTVYETFIPQTIQNYGGQKQVLSTPFLFYFGLAPGKTSMDLLTKYFGPKNAFGTETAIVCPTFDGASPTPSSTPAPSYTPPPTPASTDPFTTPTPTPSISVTPSAVASPSFAMSSYSGTRSYDQVGVGNVYPVDFSVYNAPGFEVSYDGDPILTWDMENMVFKAIDPTCGPSWMEMVQYNYYTSSWSNAPCGSYYDTTPDVRLGFYCTSVNNEGVDRSAEFSFTQIGGAPWPSGIEIFTFTQLDEPPAPSSPIVRFGGTDIDYFYDETYSNIYINQNTYSFSVTSNMSGPLPLDVVDWSITRDNCSEILASGTLGIISKPGWTWNRSGTLSSTVQSGDIIYINIGSCQLAI